MSTSSFLDTFLNYSVEEFIEFLKNNGLSEFETIAIRKNIDGHTFLNLAEFEINNWRPLLSSYQAKKFWSFLNQLRQSPELFVFVASKPVVPSKPSVNKEHLQKLSQNDSFIHSLRNAVNSRTGVKKNEFEEPESTSNAKERKAPEIRPPRPPAHKKPFLPPPQLDETESDHSESDLIYESPDEESEPAVRNRNFGGQLAKPLPQIPRAESPPASTAATNAFQEPLTKNTQSKSPQRQPFRFEQHYTRQREIERELAKSSAQTISNKFQKQSNPLPPIPKPSKDVSSKLSDKFNSIPRPPRYLPQVEVPKIQPVAEEHKPETMSMEQESYYRYTDRKGAEELLSEEYDNGTFLLRPSRAYHGTLSVRAGDKIYHIGINKIDDDLLEMESSGLNLKFRTLNEIITYFKNNPITVRNKYNQIVEVYLNKTLPPDRT